MPVRAETIKTMQFKVGDRVKAKPSTPYLITTNGWEGVVEEVSEFSSIIYVRGEGIRGNRIRFDVNSKYFDLVESKTDAKPHSVNFILVYEPYHKIEEFETMADVEDRVKHLSETEPSLVRDSVFVYAVKGKREVSIETTIKYE